MKLWDVLAPCLLLLTSVSPRPLNLQPAQRAPPLAPRPSDPLTPSEEDAEDNSLQDGSMEDQYDITDDITGPYPEQFDDVMDFIKATIGRLRRSPPESGGSRAPRGRGGERARPRGGGGNTERGGGGGEGGGGEDNRRGRKEKKKSRGGRKGKGGRGGEKEKESSDGRAAVVLTRGCLLKEVHLNVTDLGLGYQTKEELIFRYCSGPCAEAETNYDKILDNLAHSRKLDRKDAPARVCCRPIAFDDDLSFLDDNVVYHTLKKHSARRCGCV